jgi:hypothetical protein
MPPRTTATQPSPTLDLETTAPANNATPNVVAHVYRLPWYCKFQSAVMRILRRIIAEQGFDVPLVQVLLDRQRAWLYTHLYKPHKWGYNNVARTWHDLSPVRGPDDVRHGILPDGEIETVVIFSAVADKPPNGGIRTAPTFVPRAGFTVTELMDAVGFPPSVTPLADRYDHELVLWAPVCATGIRPAAVMHVSRAVGGMPDEVMAVVCADVLRSVYPSPLLTNVQPAFPLTLPELVDAHLETNVVLGPIGRDQALRHLTVHAVYCALAMVLIAGPARLSLGAAWHTEPVDESIDLATRTRKRTFVQVTTLRRFRQLWDANAPLLLTCPRVFASFSVYQLGSHSSTLPDLSDLLNYTGPDDGTVLACIASRLASACSDKKHTVGLCMFEAAAVTAVPTAQH